MQPAGVGGKVDAYDPSRASTCFSLPPGITSADGGSHMLARSRGGATPSCPATASPTRPLASWLVVPGRWQLAGVSPNGRLRRPRPAAGDKQRTDVVIVNMPHAAASRTGSHLRGDFEVETVSRDGKRLFLIQHLPDDRPAALPRPALRSLARQARLEAACAARESRA